MLRKSISFVHLKLGGEQLIGEKKFYLITYSDIQGKELSTPEIKYSEQRALE